MCSYLLLTKKYPCVRIELTVTKLIRWPFTIPFHQLGHMGGLLTHMLLFIPTMSREHGAATRVYSTPEETKLVPVYFK